MRLSASSGLHAAGTIRTLISFSGFGLLTSCLGLLFRAIIAPDSQGIKKTSTSVALLLTARPVTGAMETP